MVIYHHPQGLEPGDILQKLQQEGIKATGLGIAKFLAKFIESASVARKPWNGRPFYAVFLNRKTLSPRTTHKSPAPPLACPLQEVRFYRKVSFGAQDLSVVQSSEVVRYSGAVNVLLVRE